MKRVLLKLSGEALAGEKKTGFDEATVIEVAKQIRTIAEEGLHVLLQNIVEVISGEDAPVRLSTEIRLIRLVCLQQL